MRVVVKKRGSAAVIRIPLHVLGAVKIKIDDPVDIREEQGRIVIEPLPPTSYDLADVIEKITSDNLHDEADFGWPVGKEIL
jgi:antitoxin MazE